MKRNAVISVALTAALAVGLLTGCAKRSRLDTETSSSQENPKEPEKKRPLSVASGKLTGRFSMLFPETEGDRRVAELTSVSLLGKDRSGDFVLSGISGETRAWKGSEYSYTGIADCHVEKKKGKKTTYTFDLRQDLVFSDGELLTADDLIFTMYACLDAAYDGDLKAGELPIAGLAKYRGKTKPMYKLLLDRGEKNTVFDVYNKKTQKTFFKTDWPKAQLTLIRNIMKHYKTKSVAKAMIALDYANKDESGRVNSNYTFQHWSMKGKDKPDEKDFLRELQFTASLDVVSENLVKNGIVEEGVYELLPEKYQRTIQIGKTSAKYITGIKKKGKFSVQVVLTRDDPEALEKLSLPVLPLHYYGDKTKYNYKKHKFGFNKGDLTRIKAKTKEPIGAGPYIFERFADGVAVLRANPRYYKGAPVTGELRVTAMNEEDMAYEITEGAIDIAEPSITKSDALQLQKVNTNGRISGDVIRTELMDHPSYGYIGMNGAKVSVAGQPLSEASINLRRALAVVLSYYRFSSVHRYYGDIARLIDYPIGRDDWASPQSWDRDYAAAYSRDVAGRRIWTKRMTRAERTAAVSRAALGYFAKAGYTVKKGKLTQAPQGGPMSLTVLVTGYGEKDHPSYRLLKNAKKLLSSLGFTLKIKDEGDSGEMFTRVQTGNAQLWCAAWPTGSDPDTYIYSLYHSKGGSAYMYGVQSEKLDRLVTAARDAATSGARRKKYKKCLEYIRSLAVEIPVYQRLDCTLFGGKSIDPASLPPDATSHYNWRDGVEKIRLTEEKKH